jgi:hypothetical protein
MAAVQRRSVRQRCDVGPDAAMLRAGVAFRRQSAGPKGGAARPACPGSPGGGEAQWGRVPLVSIDEIDNGARKWQHAPDDPGAD